MNNNLEIQFLADCKEHIPFLAQLWHEEISRHWVADASIEKAKDRLIAHLNKKKMPIKKQKEKINIDYKKISPDEIIASGTFQALQMDIELSGIENVYDQSNESEDGKKES